MDRIYAPWRSKYVVDGVGKKHRSDYRNGCVFCHQIDQSDDDSFFILKRYKHCFVQLNRYPYNGGHILVLPYEHVADIESLSIDVRTELFEIVNMSVVVLKKAFSPNGFNIGLNLGEAGGGGIPAHIHFHVLPRWNSDTSYISTIGNTKVVSPDLIAIFNQLKPYFER